MFWVFVGALVEENSQMDVGGCEITNVCIHQGLSGCLLSFYSVH